MILGNNANPFSQRFRRKLPDSLAADKNRCCLGPKKPQKNMDQCRFAAAAGSAKDRHRPGGNEHFGLMIKQCISRVGKRQVFNINSDRFSQPVPGVFQVFLRIEIQQKPGKIPNTGQLGLNP